MENKIITINYKQLLIRVAHNWYWFALCIFFFLFISFTVLRYQSNKYMSQGLFLIEDRTRGKKVSGLKSEEIYDGIYDTFKMTNIKNQIIEFQTYNGLKNVIKKLNLEISYFFSGKVKKHIRAAHFDGIEIAFDRSHDQPMYTYFKLTKTGNKIWEIEGQSQTTGYNYESQEYVTIPATKIDQKFYQSTEIVYEALSFSIDIDTLKTYNIKKGTTYEFKFNSYPTLVAYHKSRLSFELFEKGSSVIQVSYLADLPNEGVTFINALMEDYLEHEINLKKNEGQKMLDFINKQLTSVRERMLQTEQSMTRFELKNKSLELSMQSQKNFDKIDDIQNILYKLELQNRSYRIVEESIDTIRSIAQLSTPLSLIEEDRSLLNQLDAINVEAIRYSEETLKPIPSKRKLAAIKINYFDNIDIVKQSLKDIKQDLSEQIQKQQNLLRVAVSKENSLPEAKLAQLSLERDFSIDDDIYTYLLQSQTEMQIRLNSITPLNRIINRAQTSRVIAQANKKVFYPFSILLGLLLPLIVIVLKDFFLGKIVSGTDLEYVIEEQPLVNIGHFPKGERILTNNMRNMLDEQFSQLRILIDYKLQSKEQAKVIMVTSCQKAEGKTFTAVNLAYSNAFYGKKTLLIDTDHDNAKLNRFFAQATSNGLFDALNSDLTAQKIIHHTEVPNLDIIFSGSITEHHQLTQEEQDKFQSLLSSISQAYDTIIIDTAPIGISSETMNFIPSVHYLLYVVRARYTTKSMLLKLIKYVQFWKKVPYGYVLNDFIGSGMSHSYPYSKKKSPVMKLFKRQ